MRPELRDRLFAGIGTVTVVGLLGVVLVLGLSVDVRTATEHALAVFDVRPPPPPPPPPHPLVKPRAKGHAAPRALRNKATPVVVPPPVVIPPVPPPIVVAPKPDAGAASQTGASDRAGPGHGAGGRGNGDGGGGDGSGDGDSTPPVQIGGRFRASDLPWELAIPGVEYSVSVDFEVEPNGRVDRCVVRRSSGSALLDTRVCQLIEQRYRFRPELDPGGRPVSSTIVDERVSLGIDRDDYPGDRR